MLSFIFGVLALIFMFYFLRWIFYKKESDGKYRDVFSGTFLWEGGKAYLQATIWITVALVIFFGCSAIFGI